MILYYFIGNIFYYTGIIYINIVINYFFTLIMRYNHIISDSVRCRQRGQAVSVTRAGTANRETRTSIRTTGTGNRERPCHPGGLSMRVEAPMKSLDAARFVPRSKQ